RYERSGTLAGMNRVRSFALNDAHIFCTPEQLMEEVKGAIDLSLYFSKVLGIDEFWYRLSTRDDVKEKWLGSEDRWQEAQAAHAEFAGQVASRLRAARVRVHLDKRSERLDRKIRDAKLKKVPYIAVIGGKEVESGHVNIQNRAGEKTDVALDEFVNTITAEIA